MINLFYNLIENIKIFIFFHNIFWVAFLAVVTGACFSKDCRVGLLLIYLKSYTIYCASLLIPCGL